MSELTILTKLTSLYVYGSTIQSIVCDTDELYTHLLTIYVNPQYLQMIPQLNTIRYLALVHISLDLNLLDKFPNVEEISIVYGSIKNLYELRFCTKSVKLRIGLRNLTSLNGIEKGNSLVDLTLEGNDITDISNLRFLTNLTYIDLSNNKLLNDFTPLTNLKKLETLRTACAKFANVSCLYRIPKLQLIYYGPDGYVYNFFERDIFLKLWDEIHGLLEKYWILTKFSYEREFTNQIVDRNKFAKFVNQKDHARLCVILEELEVAYDRLWYAPYGPHFIEGLSLCKK